MSGKISFIPVLSLISSNGVGLMEDGGFLNVVSKVELF